ncbi:MAG TPA: XRE family transcriptional regulator [Candidatus Baltobacteraceae bacterium]|nr:XRE family transcriptional regulator [Candidatus Baltobacteraceae bacterium]
MAEQTIGAKVKLVRESRKLSVEQVADRAALKPQVIEQIESGALVPSLTPLIRIARALGVRLGTFLDDQENVGPVLVRAGEKRKVMRVSDKDHPGPSDLDFFSLAANKTGRHMEPFLIDIHPSSAQEAHLSEHEGEEFIYVFSGEVEIRYGTEVYRLSAGDSIYYDSIVVHHVHCAGSQPAQILAVVYAPF